MAMGKRIGELMEARGWDQAEMCRRVNALIGDGGEIRPLSQQALSAIITRDSNKSDAAAYIAEALGVSLRWLLTGKGTANDPEWPFARLDRARWDACDDGDRGYLQAAINRALDECEELRRSSGASGKQSRAAA